MASGLWFCDKIDDNECVSAHGAAVGEVQCAYLLSEFLQGGI